MTRRSRSDPVTTRRRGDRPDQFEDRSRTDRQGALRPAVGADEIGRRGAETGERRIATVEQDRSVEPGRRREASGCPRSTRTPCSTTVTPARPERVAGAGQLGCELDAVPAPGAPRDEQVPGRDQLVARDDRARHVGEPERRELGAERQPALGEVVERRLLRDTDEHASPAERADEREDVGADGRGVGAVGLGERVGELVDRTVAVDEVEDDARGAVQPVRAAGGTAGHEDGLAVEADRRDLGAHAGHEAAVERVGVDLLGVHLGRTHVRRRAAGRRGRRASPTAARSARRGSSRPRTMSSNGPGASRSASGQRHTACATISARLAGRSGTWLKYAQARIG